MFNWFKGKGWKTWVGGAAMIAAGGYMCYNGQLETGIPIASAGLAAWGIGHKAERLKEIIEAVKKKEG